MRILDVRRPSGEFGIAEGERFASNGRFFSAIIGCLNLKQH
jgi:hypothetical protein